MTTTHKKTCILHFQSSLTCSESAYQLLTKFNLDDPAHTVKIESLTPDCVRPLLEAGLITSQSPGFYRLTDHGRRLLPELETVTTIPTTQ